MQRGYIKLWRSSQDNKLYFSESFTKFSAWIDLLLLANHKSNVVYIRGIPIDLERGQTLGCERFLAKRWKWSRTKVRNFLLHLCSKSVPQIEPQIKLVKNNVSTVITILNYETYQGNSTTKSTTDRATECTTEVPQKDLPKKVKKEKNVKNKDFVSFLPTEWVNGKVSAWNEWIAFRKELKKPVTEMQARKQIEMLVAQPDPIACINHSISNGYQGLFELSAPKPQGTKMTYGKMELPQC